MKRLGEMIIKRRKEKDNMSAAELARRVKVHRSYITKIEKDGLLPLPKVMKRIQKVLGDDLGAIYEKEQATRLKYDNMDKKLLDSRMSVADTASTLSIKGTIKITKKDQQAIEKSLEKLRQEKKKFDAIYEKEKKKILDKLKKKKK